MWQSQSLCNISRCLVAVSELRLCDISELLQDISRLQCDVTWLLHDYLIHNHKSCKLSCESVWYSTCLSYSSAQRLFFGWFHNCVKICNVLSTFDHSWGTNFSYHPHHWVGWRTLLLQQNITYNKESPVVNGSIWLFYEFASCVNDPLPTYICPVDCSWAIRSTVDMEAQ